MSFHDTIDKLGAIGFRLDMIMPADDPHIAQLSNGDVKIRVEAPAPAKTAGWRTGRAGMQYRDLIPERPGFIASHIRVPDGGPVADYVHFHEIGFQIIYCYKGWVRLVYEDQGEPFVMREGEGVLQPPKIRHRVLECSPGLEVVEVAAPSVHATHVDHDLVLPNGRRDREYDGQRFAFGSLPRVRVRRDVQPITQPVFGFILRGSVERDGQPLVATAAFFGTPALSQPSHDLEWLEVAV